MYYERVPSKQCPRAQEVATFWGSLVQLAGYWLALDALACAFFLHCSWALPCIGRLARLAGFVLACMATYGAVEYCRLIPHRHCWDAGSALVLGILIACPVLAAFWWAVYDDCSCFCCSSRYGLGAASNPCKQACCARHLWTSNGDEYDEELGMLRRNSGSKFRFRHGVWVSVSTGRQQLRSRRSWRKIRVVRGDEVLFVGRTRSSVRRWVQQHLQDYDGVFVEDLHGASREAKSAWKGEDRRGRGHGHSAIARRAAWAPLEELKPRRLGRDSRRRADSNSS